MGNTILFVDDEEVILNALETIFTREGFQALTASCGEEALKILEQQDVDAVVSDERMPGISGTELLCLVKDKYPDKIRVVLTAYAELNTMLSAINKVEAHRLIIKPYRIDEIVQTLRDLMERQERARENETTLLAAKREADFAYRATKIMCGPRASSLEQYSKLVHLVKDYIRAYSLSLMLLHSEENELVVHAATNEKIIGLKRHLNEDAISSRVAREGRAILYNAYEAQGGNPPLAWHDQTFSKHSNKTFLSVPLMSENRLLGVFNVTDPEEGRISPYTEKTVSHLMRWVEAMIERPLPE